MTFQRFMIIVLVILVAYPIYALNNGEQALKIEAAQRKVKEAEQEVHHAALAMKPEFQVFGRYSTFQMISAQNNLTRANKELAEAKRELTKLQHEHQSGE